MIGTNRDLVTIQRMLDRQIAELTRGGQSRTEDGRLAGRITALGRQRIMVSATLLNRRTEAAKKVVDLSRWFNGNGALLRSPSIERKSRTLPAMTGLPDRRWPSWLETPDPIRRA